MYKTTYISFFEKIYGCNTNKLIQIGLCQFSVITVNFLSSLAFSFFRFRYSDVDV